MKRSIRIEGIYDLETIHHLQELPSPVENFVFDLRPKSFNFLQHYRLMDIMEHSHTTPAEEAPHHRYFLHFCQESESVIQKFLLDIKGTYGDGKSSIFLEFSDGLSLDFYQHFQHPFYWHYRPETADGLGLQELLATPLLKGLIFPYSFLQSLHEQGTLDDFAEHFHTLATATTHDDKELVLALNWESDVFPSLFDLFDFSMLSLPIDEKVQWGYRRVNFTRLKEELAQHGRLFLS